MSSPPLTHFGAEQAAAYDQRFAKLAPLRDALHLLAGSVLATLPDDARVLCVGAGTGAELLALAQRFPGWTFTAVEPSGPMLGLCRSKAAAAGIADRCRFHEGFLDSLPPADPFHAATSFLVSQFVLDGEERRDFFRGIARRLIAGGTLVNADLSADRTAAPYAELFEVWLRLMEFTGLPPEAIANLRSAYGRDVAITPPNGIEGIIAAAGFEPPLAFLQTGLIRAWFARRRGDGSLGGCPGNQIGSTMR
jgi:tRNA (cmo5U34)-methyltransferase